MKYERRAVVCTQTVLTDVLEQYELWRLAAMTYAPVYCQYTLVFEREVPD